ncbi:MAG: hypothetical protein HXS54_14715 [Theionarchaea archaeon]|nr:hypothetical protein [Theionarchaea archaeon]
MKFDTRRVIQHANAAIMLGVCISSFILWVSSLILDPLPENPPQEDSGDDQGYETRQEECQHCDCAKRPDVKALLKIKRNVTLGKWGVALGYGLLCATAGAVICGPSGPAAAGCAIVLGAFCAFVMGVLTDVSLEDFYNDIHWLLDKLGCGCAIYC